MISRLGTILLGSPRRGLITVVVGVLAVSVVYGEFPVAREVAAWLTIPAAGIGALILRFPNEAKQLAGQALGHMTWLGSSVERESVRQDIEGTLSIGVGALAEASPASSRGPVHIKFMRSGEEVVALPDGAIIVGIADHRDRTRNLVAAAWAYARFAVLPYARIHLDQDVSRGIDFTITKSILSKADTRAVSQFIRDIWSPAIQGERRLKELTAKLEALEDDQLLAPVLLEEFAELGLRRANRSPIDEVSEETAKFVEHLFDLAEREPGGHDETHFEGRFIRCGFVLLATGDGIEPTGIDAYRGPVDWAIKNAFPRVYVLARGLHVPSARSVCTTFVGDERVLGVREFMAEIESPRGPRPVARLVVQIRVDVRKYTGIGQRPVMAVGDSYERAARVRRDRQRLGKVVHGSVRTP
ncbi:MAG TPA: hypothetical protein VIM30_15645 [Candidatus Limnocylindrales bacterium]|jgi:hypothetical protein